MKPVLWHVIWGVLAAWAAAEADQYSLRFNRTSTSTSWSPQFPSWSYSTPVRFSAVGDSTSKLTVRASANMGFTLNDRGGRKTWQDNASIRSSINYPILGPKAAIRLSASMSTRNATLQKQKQRSQSLNFGFSSRPLSSGPFKDLSASLTPGLITATRESRANLGSTIKETGIRYNASLRVSPAVEIAGKKLRNSISLGKSDNTLEHNKNRSESLRGNVGYTFPGEVRVGLNMSESRSQQGVTRRVISEAEVGEATLRDTVVSAELSETHRTSLSSNVEFDLGGFKIKNSASYSQNKNTNTANAAQDLNNHYFGKDRLSESFRWSAELSGKLAEKLVFSSKIRFNVGDQRKLAVRVLDTSRCDSHFTRSANGTCRDPSSDSSDRNLFVNGSLTWPLADAHSLRLTTFGEIKRSENPGAPKQDRDTFRNSVTLRYDGTLRSGTRVNVGLNSNFVHRVNLHATRASGNARNRDLLLDIGTNYDRLGASFSHNFSVSARRTIFDFDRQVNRLESSRKSAIRRGWSMRHSLRRKIVKHLSLNTRYEYAADDTGTLLTENGAQIVEEENGKHSIQCGMTYAASADYSISTNYSYRLDRQWEYEYYTLASSRSLNRRNRYRTLSATFNYNPVGSDNKLTLRGSSSRQRGGTFNSVNASYTRSL